MSRENLSIVVDNGYDRDRDIEHRPDMLGESAEFLASGLFRETAARKSSQAIISV